MAPRPFTLLLAGGALALGLTGCGGDDDSDATTTTALAPTCTVPGSEPVSFGEGEIPASVPSDLPVPNGAVVGSTMIDRGNHRTELTLSVRLEAGAVVQYYTVGLVSAGFVVDHSAGDALTWRIEFSRGDLRGGLVVQSAGAGLSAVVVSFNTC